MPYTGKGRGTMETYRNEEQMQCLAKSEGCSTLEVFSENTRQMKMTTE